MPGRGFNEMRPLFPGPGNGAVCRSWCPSQQPCSRPAVCEALFGSLLFRGSRLTAVCACVCVSVSVVCLCCVSAAASWPAGLGLPMKVGWLASWRCCNAGWNLLLSPRLPPAAVSSLLHRILSSLCDGDAIENLPFPSHSRPATSGLDPLSGLAKQGRSGDK
ncbi:hypothetical protein F4780DRAFT_683973 [Xylariomycetidae sp. FL0641]|nr:hypothetical protein F4780DRAFT_683973 [Xylariomycetidae sp. FL0641]